MAGNNDSIVNVCTHLDGVDNQVTQEVQRLMLDGRHREVDPDTALNDNDEQHRQTGRFEGEQQDNDNKQSGQHTDQHIILAKGAGQIFDVGGVTDNVGIAAVILSNQGVHRIQEVHGLATFFRQVQVDNQAAVFIALQLQLCLVQLFKQVIQRFLNVAVQRNVAVFHLPLQEHEHIKQRYFIIAKAADQLAVFVLVHGIGSVQGFGHLVIQPGQFRHLARGQGIGQFVAIHSVNVGQTLGGFYFRAGIQVLEQLAFGIIIPCRHDHRHHVVDTKSVLDFLVGNLAFTLLGGDQVCIAVAVGALVGQHCGDYNHNGKNRRDNKPGDDIKLAQEGDLGDQVFMAGCIDLFAEHHQQAGHQGKHRQQAEQNSLDQHGCHIAANAKVHERQSPQAGNGGQRGRADFGDCLGQCRDTGLPRILGFVLIREAVAQDDGVVNGQCQLQNNGNGVGDKGNGATQEVGAHIQQSRRAKGHNQNRNLGIGTGRKGKHQHDDDGRQYQNDAHLALQVCGGIYADFGINIGIVPGQHIPDGMQCMDADIVRCGTVKRYAEQRRSGFVVVRGIIKIHAGNAINAFQVTADILGGFICNIGNHHAGCAVCNKVIIHHGQALAGFGILRQVGSNIIFHLDPAGCYNTEN